MDAQTAVPTTSKLTSSGAAAFPEPGTEGVEPRGAAHPGPRMSWPKRIFAALFVLAIAGVVAASLRPKAEPPITVQAASARKGAITRIVTGGGKLEAATEVKLSSNITGDLVELSIREGDRVARGQVLGRIDARRYGAQLAQAEGARNSAAADLQVARVRADSLAAELKRVAALAAGQNASAAELDRAQADLDGARAQAAATEQRLAQADAALREGRHQFSLTTITSPMDGIVTQRLKQVGERVRGSDFSEDVIMVIATLSKMEMKAEIGEHEVVYVKEGDQADIEIDAFPERKFKAQVVEVARKATVKNAGTEQEVTTFIVRMALLDQVPGALPGMSAQASVATDTREDAVVVPIAAVTVRPEKDLKPKGAEPTDQAASAPPVPPVPGKKARKEPLKKVIFVVQDGVAHARVVETGLASDTEIEIVSGLQPGERVVEGPYRVLSKELAEGKKVKEEEPGKKGEAGKAKGS
jgi:HlyD family secretion protein